MGLKHIGEKSAGENGWGKEWTDLKNIHPWILDFLRKLVRIMCEKSEFLLLLLCLTKPDALLASK